MNLSGTAEEIFWTLTTSGDIAIPLMPAKPVFVPIRVPAPFDVSIEISLLTDAPIPAIPYNFPVFENAMQVFGVIPVLPTDCDDAFVLLILYNAPEADIPQRVRFTGFILIPNKFDIPEFPMNSVSDVERLYL